MAPAWAVVYLFIAVTLAKQVTIPDLGTLEGTITFSSWTNRTIYQYQGIPYAEPPVGALRFKRPVRYSRKWEGIFKATEFGPICPQDSYITRKLGEGEQSEDCLHINVYTPKTGNDGVGSGMPVIVYVHGGFFIMGSARNVAPNFLLEEDIVLVVPQHRLGPLGFLSLRTEDVPGNQGMLDVLLALEWVHTNIEHFGGDPMRVTLFGQSSGAAAVTLMLFSPLVSDNLFERVIFSGTSALGRWVIDSTPVEHAQIIAAHANCTQDDLSQLAECLRSDTSVRQLLNAYAEFSNQGHLGGNLVVFNESGDHSFLQDHPQTLLREGKFKRVPAMGGVTKHEGSIFLADMYLRFGRANLSYLQLFMPQDIVPYFSVTGAGNDLTPLVLDIFSQVNITRVAPAVVDLLGVARMKASTFAMVTELSREVPSYLYSFNYHGRFSSFGCFSTFGPEYPWTLPFPAGVSHADDLLYIFPQNYTHFNKEETEVAKMMVRYWSSFATNGVPSAEGSPVWPKVTTRSGPYMKIDKNPAVHEDFLQEYSIAWREGLSPHPSRAQGCQHKTSREEEVSTQTTVLPTVGTVQK